MAGQYGQASASDGRTLADTCYYPICSATDYTAWRASGQVWVSFWQGLVAEAEQKIGAEKMPTGVKAGRAAADDAVALITGPEPWIYVSSAETTAMAQAQQTLRDHAGLVADALLSAGLEVQGAPTDAPPPPPSTADKALDTVTKVGIGLAVAWVVVSLLRSKST